MYTFNHILDKLTLLCDEQNILVGITVWLMVLTKRFVAVLFLFSC